MTIAGSRDAVLLFFGDIVIFLISLWVTLFIRYLEVPDTTLLYNHLVPFSFLFLVWLLVFLIAGLYGTHTVIFKRRLPGIILRVQILNVLIAALFFFLVPSFGIAPKTNLFIYLIVSFGFIVSWRLYIFPLFAARKKRNALLIGTGTELPELKEEINNNSRYDLYFVETVNLDLMSSDDIVADIEQVIQKNGISVIVIDATDERVIPILPTLYSLIFLGIDIIDMSRVYEGIFERVPLSFVKQDWLIGHVSIRNKMVYDALKRTFDFLAALVIGGVSLIFYPFVLLAIRLDDGGSFFYTQERVGESGKTIHIKKFRSMSETKKEKVTRVGQFLRKTRIDELPQILAVLRGDLSLIGPRPEKPDYVALYEHRIPYYNIRHLIKPGLSGWAQIHQDKPPKFGVQYDETALKLSYDLYYIKHRSFPLDLQIALQTIKTLFSRSGV